MALFYIFVAASFILALLIEGSVLSFFIVEKALPDINLVLVIALGFLLGERRGAVIGVCAGLLQDIIFGSVLGYFALAKMLIGYGAGRLGREFYQDQLLAPVLLVLVGTLSHEFLLYFLVHQFIGLGAPVEWSLSQYFVPKSIYNTILTLFIYPWLYHFYYSRQVIGLKTRMRGRRFYHE